MKEFKPSHDFVSRVMKNVHTYENIQKVKLQFSDKLLASRLFRYALSGAGIFAGIFLSPLACI